MKKVLFTRKLNFLESMQCLLHGIFPVVKSMIKIEPIALAQEKINHMASGRYPYFVFTSKNAVKFFLKTYNKHLPGISFNGIEFIVIGKQTGRGLTAFKNKVHVFNFAREQSFADYLAQITQDKPYLYFCSDLAALKWKWKANHENAFILENYKTIATETKVSLRGIKNVVFMSSSAVHSFFQRNKLADDVTCFVIGEPTRTTLLNYHHGTILKPKDLSFKSIVLKLMQS